MALNLASKSVFAARLIILGIFRLGPECGVEPLSEGEILIRISMFLHMSSLWNQEVNRA